MSTELGNEFSTSEWMQRIQDARAKADAEHARRLRDDPDYRDKCEAEEAERLAKEQAKADAEKRAEWVRARADLVDRGIPMKDVEAILGGTLKDTAALNVARGWFAHPGLTVLVLSGTRGCGKTTAASWCVAQEPPRDPLRGDRWFARPASERRYWAPLFVDVTRLQRASRYDQEQMWPFERAAVLAIDDLGLEYADVKGSFTALFDGLFNARYANEMKTVITTNLTAADFKARYGERVADRIRECGRFVELNDPSLRGVR